MADGRRRAALFLVAQAAIVAAVAGWGIARWRAVERARELPAPLAEARVLVPLYDEPGIVPDAALARVLPRLGLRFEGDDTSIAAVDHSLRLWGAERRFDDPATLDGPTMRRLLLDHRVFARTYGPATPPLLIEADHGVRVRTAEGTASASHWDHTLATLTEVGTPLGSPVQTPDRRTTFRALLDQSLADFSLNQAEYEWSVLAYALWLPPGAWRSSEGQEITFDRLAERVMRERLPDGVCSANHRLYALVALLRVDGALAREGRRLLSPPARARVEAFLARATALLARHQHPQGFWNFDWPLATPASAEPTAAEGDRLGDRIIATGHALEWWALAPSDLLPPRATLERAAGWVVSTVDGLSDAEIQRYNSFLTHAGRALALWRGQAGAARTPA